jgi:hypothetical protein
MTPEEKAEFERRKREREAVRKPYNELTEEDKAAMEQKRKEW